MPGPRTAIPEGEVIARADGTTRVIASLRSGPDGAGELANWLDRRMDRVRRICFATIVNRSYISRMCNGYERHVRSNIGA
jgi:hypothetical protein